MTEKPSFCQYCGKPLNSDAQYCGYCGKPVRSETPPPVPVMGNPIHTETPPPVPVIGNSKLPFNPNPNPSTRRNPNRGLLIGLLVLGAIIILLMIIGLVAGLNASSQTPTATEAADTSTSDEVEISLPTDTQEILPTATEEFFPTETEVEDLTQYVVINEVRCEPDSVGYTEVNGTLTNIGPYPLTIIHLIGRVKDQNGNVLSISDGYPDIVSLQPGNSSTFSVWVNGIFDNSTCTIDVRSADIDNGG